MTEDYAASAYAPRDPEDVPGDVEDAGADDSFTGDNAQSVGQVRKPPTFAAWVQERFMGRDIEAERHERLLSLNQAIERYPDAAANYVLRGELYLEIRAYEDAAQDFETAMACAEEEYAGRDWGIVAQSLRDRALHGLNIAILRGGLT